MSFFTAVVRSANVSVPLNSAAQTIANWATGISSGAANEAQTLNFIVSSTNTGIFNAAPAIAANGTLTFTPKNNQMGTSTVTVQLHDNGGVANGGVDTSAVQTFTISITNTPATYVVTNTADSALATFIAACRGTRPAVEPYYTDAEALARIARDIIVYGGGNIAVAHAKDEFIPEGELDDNTDTLMAAVDRFSVPF